MNNKNTYYGLENGYIPGILRCKECGESWTKDFIPDICPECGTRLAATPGEGFEPILRLFEQAGLPCPVFRCEFCGVRIYEQWELPWCPRCKGDISHMTRRSRRTFLKIWRFVSSYWRLPRHS